MRLLWAVLGALLVAQCATSEGDKRFHVGDSPRGFIIMGVAEAGANTAPNYTMLWRRVDPAGGFTRYDDANKFEPHTRSGDSVRVRGIPGEFAMAEVEPGVYALDSVFAVIRDQNVNYSANGVITGPQRPTFEVRPGEAVYLGIWELNIVDTTAVGHLWRLDPADMRAALHQANAVVGDARPRQTNISAVPCTPRRLNANSQRQIC